jgi:hypothetical protein
MQTGRGLQANQQFSISARKVLSGWNVRGREESALRQTAVQRAAFVVGAFGILFR